MHKKTIALATIIALFMLLFTISNNVGADQGDVLATYDVQTPTGDWHCLGVEFDGTYIYVTGGGLYRYPSYPYQNDVHIFDMNGNYISSVPQGTSSYWGWRDMAYDGTYFYSSDSSVIDMWYVIGLPGFPTLINAGSIPSSAPINPNRALAINPANGNFWTASFSSYIYELTPTGSIVNSYYNSYPIYGMAWDTMSPGGPWLWISEQGSYPTYTSQLRQFDPVLGVYTGVTYTIPGTAGGLSLTDGILSDYATFLYLEQGSPDSVHLIEHVELGIPADVRMEPQSLNLESNGNWVQFKVFSFPENPEYTSMDVDSTTCRVNGVNADLKFATYNDNKYIGKADRLLVEDSIGAPDQETEVTITGKLQDGTAFKGTAVIKTILN
jgi:hypothetical protein